MRQFTFFLTKFSTSSVYFKLTVHLSLYQLHFKPSVATWLVASGACLNSADLDFWRTKRTLLFHCEASGPL